MQGQCNEHLKSKRNRSDFRRCLKFELFVLSGCFAMQSLTKEIVKELNFEKCFIIAGYNCILAAGRGNVITEKGKSQNIQKTTLKSFLE